MYIWSISIHTGALFHCFNSATHDRTHMHSRNTYIQAALREPTLQELAHCT